MKYSIKVKTGIFIITVLIIGLGNNVIAPAEDDILRDKLLGNIAILKERIKDLEKIVKENRLGSLKEQIEQIRKELDKMLDEKSIEQIEEELNKAAREAKQKRINEIEERLNEKVRNDKARKNIK